MVSSRTRISEAVARSVRVTDEGVVAELMDGRTLSVPRSWYPRLLDGSQEERDNWRLIGRGEGVYGPDLDEDIGVEDLLAGRSSRETQESLRRWLDSSEEAGCGTVALEPRLALEPRATRKARKPFCA